MTLIFMRVDSLAYARDKSEIRADHTVVLTWQVDGGPVRKGEVDLTAEHLLEYGGMIEVLLGASEEAQQPPPSVAAGKKWPRWPWRPPADGGLAAPRAWGRAIRKYVDDNHLRALDEPDRPAYATPGGGSYWPSWVVRSFAWWCETGEVRVPETGESLRKFLCPYPGNLREGAE